MAQSLFGKLITPLKKAFVFKCWRSYRYRLIRQSRESVHLCCCTTRCALLISCAQLEGNVLEIKSWILPVGICRSYIFCWPNPNRYERSPEENLLCWGFSRNFAVMIKVCWLILFFVFLFFLIQSMVAFLKDPSGPPLWEENPEAKDVVHIETEKVSSTLNNLESIKKKGNDCCTPLLL